MRDAKGRLNTYVIRADDFERLYESAGKTSELGELFSAQGMVMTIELPGSFDIMAPWKERQKAKAGYLVRNGNEIYGIERFVFHRTYDLRGPGAHKLVRPAKIAFSLSMAVA